MIPKSLGHYQIEERLGAGGMGVVYRARDTSLDRTVAIKVMPEDFAANQDRMRRFVHEAKAASALSHPNIAHIYEIGEVEGVHFIAMEYVEGQRLDALIGGHPMDAGLVVGIAIQIADALAGVHARGVVHRDLKPANVLITPRGQVKVLDFGLAKLARPAAPMSDGESSPTSPGVIMGTLHYMSPEQALGRDVDHRTDIFSLGVVMHEMVTGHLPLEAGSATETIERIAHTPPDAVARLDRPPPGALERIIRRCLDEDRGRRYQSASELLTDLRSLERSGDWGATSQSEKLARRRAIYKAVGAVASALLVLFGARVYFGRISSEAIDSIAVLPFVNTRADPNAEYLTDGIAESLINSLSQLRGMRVVPRGIAFRYKGREVDPQAVGRELKVRAVLTGRVVQRGETLNIQVELIDVARLSQLWGEQYNRQLADVLGVQQEISHEILTRLRRTLSHDEQARLIRRSTASGEAYQAYLKGRYHWEKRTEEGFRTGLKHFEEAIGKDPGYALAYAGMADSYNLLARYGFLRPEEAFARAKAAATRALELDGTLAEAHTSLGYSAANYDWDWPRAEREFRQAIELNPDYATAHHWYGLNLAALGRLDEALAEARRAQELDPLSLIISSNLGRFLHYARRYDEAIEQYRKTLELNPSFGEAHLRLGKAYVQKSMYAEAIAEFEKAIAFAASGGKGALGHVYALSGRGAAARKIIAELTELSSKRYVSPYDVAIIQTGLGDKDQALEWLEKAYAERYSLLVYLNVDPELDSLKSNPRFQDLLRRVGLVAK